MAEEVFDSAWRGAYSAGVASTPPGHSGELKARKESESAIKKSMSAYHAVLTGIRLLLYTPNPEKSSKAPVLKKVLTVSCAGDWDGKGSMHHYKNAFKFCTLDGQTYQCSAPTAEDKESWVKALSEAELLLSSLSPEQKTVNSNAVASIQNRATVGRYTTGGAVIGGTVGAILGPLGLVIGASIGGAFANKMGRKKKAKRVADAQRTSMVSPVLDDSACTKCGLVFKVGLHSPMYCASCSQSFCTTHCSERIALPQLNVLKPANVCRDCFHRQNKANFVQDQTRRVCSLQAKGGPWKVLSSLPYDEETVEHLKAHFKSSSVDVLGLVHILYASVTKRKHVLELAVLAQLIVAFERDPLEFEFYWPQVLDALPQHDVAAGLSDPSILFFTYFIKAVGYRSAHLLLQAVWHYKAKYQELVDTKRDTEAHMIHAVISMALPIDAEIGPTGLSRSFVESHLATHQTELILQILPNILLPLITVRTQQASNPFSRWLLAASPQEAEASRKEVFHMVEKGTFTDEFLPLHGWTKTPISFADEDANIATWGVENFEHWVGLSFEQPPPQGWSALAINSRARVEWVNNEAEFVETLTDIAENLRFVKPVSDRKKHLLPLLEELQSALPEDSDNNCYNPLCDCLSTCRRVVRVLPSASHVFSTRARAPTLIAFEVVDTPRKVSESLGSSAEQSETEQSWNKANWHEGRVTSYSGSEDQDVDPVQTAMAKSGSLAEYDARSDTSSMDSSMSDLKEEIFDSVSHEDANNMMQEVEQRLSPPETPLRKEAEPHASSEKVQRGSSAVDLMVEEAQNLYEEHVQVVPNNQHDSANERKSKIAEESPFSHLPGWDVDSLISKSNDDLRQEVFTTQMLFTFQKIFDEANMDLWVRPYRILTTGPNVGLIETLEGTNSFDGLKKQEGFTTLRQHFIDNFGPESSETFKEAQHNFISSMAAYSLITYVLQIKDRHNGNILLDDQGHVIHIDFGFLLGIAPGGSFSLEKAPFKLTQEMVEVMGGIESEGYQLFKKLFINGFVLIRMRHPRITRLAVITAKSADSMPCFAHTSAGKVLRRLRYRLQVDATREAAEAFAERLVDHSYNHYGTTSYDKFQKSSNGILP